MELRHIRYLIAAGEEEHFGRAAERLNVTRSAVSQIIADFENELGFALFERQAQKIRLTAAGRSMLPRLNALLKELNETVALGRRVGQGKSGLLKIGYGSLGAHHPFFRKVIKRFHEQFPDVVLSLMEIPTSRQLKAMQDGVIQAGFMHVGPHSPEPGMPVGEPSDGEWRNCEFRRIDAAALALIVPRDHPLARKPAARLRDLAGEPLVMVHNSWETPVFRHVYRLCQAAGFEPQIVQEVSATGTQQDLVAVGVGIGLSVIGKGYTYPPELCALLIEDIDYEIGFQLGWMRGDVEPTLQRFIELVASLADT